MFLVVSSVAIAAADPRHTIDAVVVHKNANSKSRSVGKLAANTPVTIEKEAGGWIQIRAKVGRKQIVGFVPSAALDVPAPVATPATPPDDASEEGFVPTTDEPRKTIEAVVVRKKPGEKEAAAGNLPANTIVRVEGEKGRWFKIRAGDVAGYLPRTLLTGSTPATDTTAIPTAPTTEPPPQTWGGKATELAAEATATSALRADAKPDAAVLAPVAPGAKLVVLDATGVAGFIRVRDALGQVGWIPRAHVGNGSAGAAITGSVEPQVTKHSDAPTTAVPIAPQRRMTVRVDAGLGYRVLGMDFTSDGGAGLANYVARADASAAEVAVDVAMRPSSRLVVAVDGEVGASHSSPGIDYPGPSGPPGDIAFSTVAIDAGVRAGIHVRRMFEIAARAGGHYDAFITTHVENAGTLPRERLLGATLGARVDIVPPGSRVSATLHADALVVGSRKQTPGLEDGTSSTARAVWGGLTARFQLGKRFAVNAGYDFGRATTEWSGMSVREPGVTSARRIDSTQLVRIGISIGL